MTDPTLEQFPQPFATALFSFLYHLASYESGKCILFGVFFSHCQYWRMNICLLGVIICIVGGEALVSCGMMESLLKVINWYGDGQEHITVSICLVLLFSA